MSDLLNKATVLVLNRNWQAIHVRTPADAYCQLASGVATALDIEGEGSMRPVKWSEWITLPVREQDFSVKTVRGPVRVPTVVIAVNYAQVPKKRPKLCPRSIRERDGSRCQYTGKLLRHDEGNIDHVIPRSRGGRDTWENLVWACKKLNSKKGSKLLNEAGLKLLKEPRAPKEVPVTMLIRNTHEIDDWRWFVNHD